MKKVLLYLSVLAALTAMPNNAHADACSNGARQIAASENATVISVQSRTNGSGQTVCTVRLRVNSPGQPARIITRTFRA